MPKQDRDLIHFFMTKALTDKKTDLAMYNNPAFLQDLRVVAIESILAILQKIQSEQKLAAKHRSNVSLLEIINTKHPVTGLTMLDYCLVAGLEELALQLMRLGAQSQNMQGFHQRINRTFMDMQIQPEIINNVYTIVNNFILLKKQYDQLVATTQAVMPSCISAVKSLWSNRNSTAVMLTVGVGCAVVAPALYPLVHHAGSALLLPAIGIPAFLSGGSAAPASPAHIGAAEEDLVKNLIQTTKRVKQDLTPTGFEHSRSKPRAVPAHKKATLFYHLAKPEHKHKEHKLHKLLMGAHSSGG